MPDWRSIWIGGYNLRDQYGRMIKDVEDDHWITNHLQGHFGYNDKVNEYISAYMKMPRKHKDAFMVKMFMLYSDKAKVTYGSSELNFEPGGWKMLKDMCEELLCSKKNGVNPEEAESNPRYP